MKEQDIIRLVREAGWSGIYTQWAEPTGKPDWSPVKESLTVPVTMAQIERFATLVASAEREACAKVCDAVAKKMDDEGEGPTGYIAWVTDCAAAIRARGNK